MPADYAAMRREEIALRQQRWMDERSAEKDRSEAVAELSGRADAAPPPAAQVLERVTQKIAERLQVEVRQEMAKSAAAPGGEVHAALESHLENHACSICYEVMCAPRRPTLLSPCGHTFCSVCLEKVLAQRNASCPQCRTPVASSAVNFSLQTVIDNFVATRQALARGDAPPRGAARPMAAAPEAVDYAEQHRQLSVRCRVLETQRDEASAEVAAATKARATADRVLAHLREEESAARARLKVLEEQVAEQLQRCGEAAARDLSAAEQLELLERTLAPLQVEREKAELLARARNSNF